MSDKNYAQMYEDKLKALKEKTLGSKINDSLEMKAIGNRKIETIIEGMTKITGKKVWEDFNFRTGKIFGILRSIAQNPQQRKELLEVTGLTQDYVDIYFNICGNLPYINTSDNTLNEGRPMDIEATKEFIAIVAAKFNVLVEESDLADITMERWKRLHDNAMAKCMETIKHNEQHAEEIPQQGYEE